MENINHKIEKVKEILAGRKIAISFSGGADSTLLAYLAKDVCEDVLLITYDNCIMPSGFLDFARKKASQLRIKHEIIENNFVDISEFVENTSNRCYVCRKLMYGAIKQVANEKGYQIIMDGTNINDLVEDRPGMLVNYEENIVSPFLIAKLESDEIHKYLDENNIEYSKATTCLGTRIKTGKKITADKINRISYCEDIIKDIVGSEEIRLREENNIGTIEIKNVENIIDNDKINQIKDQLKPMSYDKLLLNISYEDEKSEFADYTEDPTSNKITFEKDLPYKINLESTYQNLKFNNENKTKKSSFREIRYLEDIGFISLEFENKEKITIFKTGKITGNNFNSKEAGKNCIINILTEIIRK